jgi:hypothetical protein
MGWHSDYYPPSDTVGGSTWACAACHVGTIGTSATDLTGVDANYLHSSDSGCDIYDCHY